MLTEVLSPVAAYVERERLANKKGSTELLRQANVDVFEKAEQFQWAWRRRGMTSAITIWTEGVHVVGGERWLSVEPIDIDHRRSGRPWLPIERPRAERRFSIVREAFRSRSPLLAFLQINRWSQSDLVNKDETSDIAVRVRDKTPWRVVKIDEARKLAVLVRGDGWEPSQSDIEAALARWKPRDTTEAGGPPPAPAFDVMTAPVLFVNIAWMRRYQGPADDDPVAADNFTYFTAEGHSPSEAHEQWNFTNTQGQVFGYVPRSPQISVGRLGAPAGADSASGVLVVFISRDPAEDVLKVVGWYENATVHKREVFTHDRGRLTVRTAITAASATAMVLPVADRRIEIPTAQRQPGGVGQSPLWYAAEHPAKVAEVRALIATLRRVEYAPIPPAPGRAPRQPDIETRLKVEKAAMELALAYFDGAVDVSKECKGWDIDARDSRGVVFVEVKGLSGPVVNVELTPNEFAKMEQYKARYILFVVTGALTQRPLARVFRFQADIDSWISGQGDQLQIAPVIGARATLSRGQATEAAPI